MSKHGNSSIVHVRLDAMAANMKEIKKALANNDAAMICVLLETMQQHLKAATEAASHMP